jgi:hypothetical protein
MEKIEITRWTVKYKQDTFGKAGEQFEKLLDFFDWVRPATRGEVKFEFSMTMNLPIVDPTAPNQDVSG